jgi:hypothetical protein
MAHHGPPKTFDEAMKRGFKRVHDVEGFAQEHFGLSRADFHARQHALSALAAVDCSTAEPGTPCSSSCDETTHIGVFGRCENGGCAFYSGPC